MNMFLGEGGPDFPALLKNIRGELQAEGRAIISRKKRSVTFSSDFVPLYPVGTPMEIVRLHQKTPIHRFEGLVYLSDKQLMRLVSVEDELLPGAEEVYCTETNFSAKLTTRRGRENFFRRLFPKAADTYTVKIVAFNRKQAEFRLATKSAFEEGTHFVMEAKSPLPLPRVTVEIRKAMLFGPSASYLCDFTDLTPEDEECLHNFMLEYTELHGALTGI